MSETIRTIPSSFALVRKALGAYKQGKNLGESAETPSNFREEMAKTSPPPLETIHGGGTEEVGSLEPAPEPPTDRQPWVITSSLDEAQEDYPENPETYQSLIAPALDEASRYRGRAAIAPASAGYQIYAHAAKQDKSENFDAHATRPSLIDIQY